MAGLLATAARRCRAALAWVSGQVMFKYKMFQRQKRIEVLLEKIMATQQELTTKLNAVTDNLKKVGAETTTLLAKVEELKTTIASGTVTPELQAAVDAVAAQAKVVDDLVPDAPPPAPTAPVHS